MKEKRDPKFRSIQSLSDYHKIKLSEIEYAYQNDCQLYGNKLKFSEWLRTYFYDKGFYQNIVNKFIKSNVPRERHRRYRRQLNNQLDNHTNRAGEIEQNSDNMDRSFVSQEDENDKSQLNEITLRLQNYMNEDHERIIKTSSQCFGFWLLGGISFLTILICLIILFV